MSFVTVEEVKLALKVYLPDDDEQLQMLIDDAEDEALRFLNRTQPPTLPVDYPPEYDSSSSEFPEDIPSSSDPYAKSFRRAVVMLVQASYDTANLDERAKLRKAAEVVLFPYRTNMGV